MDFLFVSVYDIRKQCPERVIYFLWLSVIFNDFSLDESRYSLKWRHNERDVVSNHQPHDCLLNRLFKAQSKKTSKLRVTGLCQGNLPMAGVFPAQMASNVENVSIWWRHHELRLRSNEQCTWPTSRSPRSCVTLKVNSMLLLALQLRLLSLLSLLLLLSLLSSALLLEVLLSFSFVIIVMFLFSMCRDGADTRIFQKKCVDTMAVQKGSSYPC